MKSKKLIAPIIITIIFVLYFAGILAVCLFIPMALWIKLIVMIVPLAFMGVIIFVLVERMKEIRSGDEDDLSQY